MIANSKLIEQAKEIHYEDWEEITELIHQSDDEDEVRELQDIQEKAMIRYEQGNKPKTRGSYKKKGDYKARSKTKHNRNWKQENIFNNNGIR